MQPIALFRRTIPVSVANLCQLVTSLPIVRGRTCPFRSDSLRAIAADTCPRSMSTGRDDGTMGRCATARPCPSVGRRCHPHRRRCPAGRPARPGPPGDAAGTPPTQQFVVCHGMTNATGKPGTRRVLAEFARYGPVTAFDFRGHGASGGALDGGRRRDRPTRLPPCAGPGTVARLPAVLIGFSLGGAVVLRQQGSARRLGTADPVELADVIVSVSAPARWFLRGEPVDAAGAVVAGAPVGCVDRASTGHPAGRAVGAGAQHAAAGGRGDRADAAAHRARHPRPLLRRRPGTRPAPGGARIRSAGRRRDGARRVRDQHGDHGPHRRAGRTSRRSRRSDRYRGSVRPPSPRTPTGPTGDRAEPGTLG